MPTQTSGGLTGKARARRRRNRADRGFANLLIEDYLERDNEMSGSGAFAPIRGRSEFLPTAIEAEEAEMDRRAQLELPLAKGRGSDRRAVWSTESERETEAAVLRIAVDDDRESKTLAPSTDKPKVIRLPRRTSARMPLGWLQQPADERRTRLTLRGFGLGCLIGGAAAALALTVLNIALR